MSKMLGRAAGGCNCRYCCDLGEMREINKRRYRRQEQDAWTREVQDELREDTNDEDD